MSPQSMLTPGDLKEIIFEMKYEFLEALIAIIPVEEWCSFQNEKSAQLALGAFKSAPKESGFDYRAS